MKPGCVPWSSELLETSIGGQVGLGQGDLSLQVSVPPTPLEKAAVPVASTWALSPPLPMAASKGSHPVERELPNDEGRSEGAGWVHRTASEVDLGSNCGFRV